MLVFQELIILCKLLRFITLNTILQTIQYNCVLMKRRSTFVLCPVVVFHFQNFSRLTDIIKKAFEPSDYLEN